MSGLATLGLIWLVLCLLACAASERGTRRTVRAESTATAMFSGVRGIISFLQSEARASSWAFCGILYAGIFGLMTTTGIAATAVLGPWEGAEERRNNRREARKPLKLDLKSKESLYDQLNKT